MFSVQTYNSLFSNTCYDGESTVQYPPNWEVTKQSITSHQGSYHTVSSLQVAEINEYLTNVP